MFRQDFAAVDAATPVTGYDVVVCRGCGAAYADGIPSQDAFYQTTATCRNTNTRSAVARNHNTIGAASS